MTFLILIFLIFLLLAAIILLVSPNKLSLLLSGVVGDVFLQGIGGFGASMITDATAIMALERW